MNFFPLSAGIAQGSCAAALRHAGLRVGALALAGAMLLAAGAGGAYATQVSLGLTIYPSDAPLGLSPAGTVTPLPDGSWEFSPNSVQITASSAVFQVAEKGGATATFPIVVLRRGDFGINASLGSTTIRDLADVAVGWGTS